MNSMQNNKTYYKTEELSDKIFARGLTIEDDNQFRELIERYNFYRIINCYRKPFLDEKKEYLQGTKFGDLLALYEFDRNLSILVFNWILILETRLKAAIILVFGEVTVYGYRNPAVYDKHKNFFRFQGFVKTLKLQVNEKAKKGSNIANHFKGRIKRIPIWALMRLLTFGQSSEMYSFLEKTQQREIANIFGVKPLGNFEKSIWILALLKNEIANGERIIRIRFRSAQLKASSIHNELGIQKNRENVYSKGISDFFAAVLSFYYLLDETEFSQFNEQLVGLHKTLSDRISNKECMKRIMNDLGFPSNWDTLIALKRKGVQ